MLETQLLSSLLDRKAYFRAKGLLQSSYFSTSIYRQLYEIICDFWKKSEADTLKKEVFHSLVEISLEDADQTTAQSTLKVLYSTDPGDANAILEKVIERWSTGQILSEALEAYQQGNFDPEGLADKFHRIVAPEQSGSDLDASPVESGIELLQSEFDGRSYSTGLPKMDAQLAGGLREKELGVILAPSHRGKTQFLCHLGREALNAGIPIQYHTFEISKARVFVRFLQGLLNVPRSWIQRHPADAAARAKALDLPLWSIRDWSDADATTGDIHSSVRTFTEAGADRPLILVDYLDLVRGSGADRSNRHDTNLTIVTQELRRIASQFGVGLWTASQVQRAAWNYSHVRMKDVAESIGKVVTADVVLTMNQNLEDESMGLLQFYIDKARERTLTDPFIGTVNDKEHQRFTDIGVGL